MLDESWKVNCRLGEEIKVTVIPPGFGQAVIHMSVVGSPREMLMTFGFEPVSTDPGAHAFEIHTALTAAGRPMTSASIATGYSYRGVSVTEMSLTGPVIGNFEANVVGSAATPPPPSNCAVLVRKRTTEGGRRNRGRMFIPPFQVSEGGVDQAGVIQAATVTAIATSWNAFWNALTTAALPQFLLHSEGPFTPTAIVGYEYQALLATQRRRMRR
jgi:hypothetical protein